MTLALIWGELTSQMVLTNVVAVWSCIKPHVPQDSQTTVLFEDGRAMTWWGVQDVAVHS